MSYIDIVFDGPPDAVAGRFLEVENDKGTSIRVGEWLRRSDGYWVLRIKELPGCDGCQEAARVAVDVPSRVWRRGQTVL